MSSALPPTTRSIADYVALAVISKISWDDADDDEFNDIFGNHRATARDFSGDLSEFKNYAEQRCGFPITEQLAQDVIRSLAECGLLRVTDDNFSGTFVKIKANEFENFVSLAQEQIQDAKRNGDESGLIDKASDYPRGSAFLKHVLYEDYHELGDQWLRRALVGLRKHFDERGVLPDDGVDLPLVDIAIARASDRLVAIDHNSRAFAEVVELTDAASESIRSSNSIDEDKRSWIRDHIGAGIALIKKHKVLASAVSALLLAPLMNAYEAVAEEPAKQAILLAINTIRAFFGI
ncbi:hypothetical protein KRZ98_02455 [Sphingobium sp. AS12]|uniref:hypothetical protein n=1 Tax=Sphingobium sp. AS12 TaxID=2849495 RepID=UPI001C31487D|nr:hypothetical protein [Sphingobium sp. AS12]MBV2147151.1 hypothetical protein [Sphingobium sp. AS12]